MASTPAVCCVTPHWNGISLISVIDTTLKLRRAVGVLLAEALADSFASLLIEFKKASAVVILLSPVSESPGKAIQTLDREQLGLQLQQARRTCKLAEGREEPGSMLVDLQLITFVVLRYVLFLPDSSGLFSGRDVGFC